MLKKEKRRVVYVRSVPEWYGHNVNDMFFRLDKWLFVPIQDLDSDHKTKELEKASYFFVSGYGNPEIAEKAHKAGCLLVGVRADVSNSIPIIECREWDPIDSYLTLLFVEISSFILPKFVFQNQISGFNRKTLLFFINLIRPLFKIIFLFHAAVNVWKKNGFKHLIIKTKNYLRKVRNT